MDVTKAENNSTSHCTVGTNLGEECHKNFHARISGILLFWSFLSKEKKLLEWCTGLSLNDDSTIRYHHEKIYISKDECLQKNCCDQIKQHKQLVKKKCIVT